jgi:hypothetical protein
MYIVHILASLKKITEKEKNVVKKHFPKTAWKLDGIQGWEV